MSKPRDQRQVPRVSLEPGPAVRAELVLSAEAAPRSADDIVREGWFERDPAESEHGPPAAAAVVRAVAEVTELSVQGLRFAAPPELSLAPGDDSEIHLTLPARDEGPVRVFGVVVRSDASGVGVRFTYMPGRARAHIAEHVTCFVEPPAPLPPHRRLLALFR